MDKFILFVEKAWGAVKGQLPAIVMAILSYQENRVKAERAAKRDVELDLAKERNKNAVAANLGSGSDADVVDRAIRDGGGTPADALTKPEPTSSDPDRA